MIKRFGNVEAGVTYSACKPDPQAIGWHLVTYRWHFKPENQYGQFSIYIQGGRSTIKDKMMKLIDHWNTKSPAVWEYSWLDN